MMGKTKCAPDYGHFVFFVPGAMTPNQTGISRKGRMNGMTKQLTAAALAAMLLLTSTACSSRTAGEASSGITSVRSGRAESSSAAEQSSALANEVATSSGVTEQQAPLLNPRKDTISSSASSEKGKTEILFSTKTPAVGETVAIHVNNAKKVTAKTNLGFTMEFFDDGDSKVALLPISYAAQPGDYTLDITADGVVSHYTLSAKDREFEIQNLTVDPGTVAETANSAAANEEWQRRVEPLKPIRDSQRHWSGKFLQPVEGTITTEYGMIRYTNGSTVASRHSGIDIAAKMDTPVLASNGGRVIFADLLQLTGNTVIIEHGYGLKSFYYHMNSIAVKEGDMVKQGQQVGAVGTTGFSTGPHLHFAMSVNHVFTNPWTMFKEEI